MVAVNLIAGKCVLAGILIRRARIPMVAIADEEPLIDPGLAGRQRYIPVAIVAPGAKAQDSRRVKEDA